MAFGRGRPRLRISNPARLTPKNAITAAGERVRSKDGDTLRRVIQPWQARAYGYYDVVPEIKYAAQFYSRMLSPLRLFAAEIDDRGEIIETTNEAAIAQLERIQDPGGGRTGLLGAYGRLMFLGGEALCCVTQETDDEAEQWEMLSPAELRKDASGSTWMRLRAPSLAPESYRDAPDDAFEPLKEDEVVVYRLWRRHPVYSELADSTMQAVLEVAEELMLLSRGVRNRARSRFASAGLLLVNGELTVVSVDGSAADEDPDEDPFLKELGEAITSAIADETSPASVVPIVLRVDVGRDESLDNVMKHIQIVDPLQLYPETGLRREAIERLAIGLDMPPEVLLGIGGLNHWAGWLVDEAQWKGHGQGIAQALVDDLTAAFFRPTLRDESVGDWQKFLIGYDPAAVINHPDKSKDAKDLHDRGSLSDKALREAGGFSDDDAPSKEERQVWLGVQLRDSSVAIDGIPSVKAGGIEPRPGVLEKAGTPTVDAGTSAAEAAKAPPEQPTQTDEPPNSVASSGLSAKILGASDLALHRARELAGARLRSLAQRDREAERLIDGVRNGQVAPTLGREKAQQLGAPSDRELVAGARNLIRDSLRLWRLDEEIAEPLGDRIEQHAARTLYDERPMPLPPSFENYVRGIEEIAA